MVGAHLTCYSPWKPGWFMMTPSNIALLPLFSLSRRQAKISGWDIPDSWHEMFLLFAWSSNILQILNPHTVWGGVSLDPVKAKKRLRSTYSWGIWISNGYSLTFNLQANHWTQHAPNIHFSTPSFWGRMSVVHPYLFSFHLPDPKGTKTSFTEQSRHLRHNLVGSAVWGFGGASDKI